jgi:hypothetical protein
VVAARQVTPGIGIAAGRVLRRWYRAKGLMKTVRVERVEQTTGSVRLRRTRKRRRLFANGRGFACVNDGPAFASQLARYLTAITGNASSHHPTAMGGRGSDDACPRFGWSAANPNARSNPGDLALRRRARSRVSRRVRPDRPDLNRRPRRHLPTTRGTPPARGAGVTRHAVGPPPRPELETTIRNGGEDHRAELEDRSCTPGE